MTLTETDDPTIRIDAAQGLNPLTDTLTVLVTDAAGSTVFLEARSPIFPNKSPEATREGALLPGNPAFSIITQYDGQLIRTVGGSVMVEFSSPVGAVRAAVEIQRLLAESNSAAPHGRALDLRIGIHACTAHRPGMDVFGDVVNVAAGITTHAAPGQILISRAVCEAVSGEADLYCPWLSQVTINGRIDKEDIFEVNWAGVPANIPSRYEVLSQVGMGGTGMVYKVRDLETQEIVALKILKPGIAADPAMQENLRREVRLARKVTHKRVCRIHEFSRLNGAAYISMEFVEGESLLSTLRRLGRLPLGQSLQIARQICAGLHEAHLHGIVHRDLKPANIMVEPSGDVKIMDFGIARLSQSNGQMTGTIAGTPAYMAPEQVELKPVGAPADIYALGLVLYEMATGIPAFAGDTPIAVALKQVRELPQRPREIVPDLPAHIESVILKCLQKDPAERFQSVDELETALEDHLLPVSPKRVALGPQIQTAGAAAARLLRATAARTFLFAGTTSRTARSLQRQASSAIAEACTNLRRKDWQAFAKTRAGQASAVAAGLTLCLLLSAVIAFALARTRSRISLPLAASSEQSLASRADQPMKPIAVSNLSASPEKSAVTSGPVDLGPGAGEGENSRNIALAAQPASAPTIKGIKIASNMSAVPAAKRKPAHAPDPSAHPALPVPPPPSDVTQVVNDQKLVDAPLDSSSSVALASAPPAAALQSAEAPNAGKTTGSIEVPPSFFEVGTFKEATWADTAVQTLNQLGFHAVSIRKSRLWNQSYHVQVGPYTDPQALEQPAFTVEFGARTDTGRIRKNNEDSFLAAPEMNLFVLSDGMGGLSAGEVASRLTVDSVAAHCRDAEADPSLEFIGEKFAGSSPASNRLASAVRFANSTVYHAAHRHSNQHGMGATVVAVRFAQERMTVAHVGDSRAYRLRGHHLEQLTQDHSLVAEQVRRGQITEREAGVSEMRNVLMRGIGVESEVEADVSEELVMDQDVILLCSDGLTRELPDSQIADVLAAHTCAQTAADRLVDLASQAGGLDNITAVVVRPTPRAGGPRSGVSIFVRWFSGLAGPL